MTATSNNIMTAIVLHKEFTVLGCANVSGNSYTIAPSADNNDSLGSTTMKWSNVFSYGMTLGNTTINSTGNTTANSASANGYTVLPGGVVLQWGNALANTTGNTVMFPVPFTVNVYSFHVTGSQANVLQSTANSTAAVVFSSAGTPTYSWLAIGR